MPETVPKYEPTAADLEKIENLFGSNPTLTDDQVARIGEIRADFKGLATNLVSTCPPGRLLAETLTDLEKACQSAVKAVAFETIIRR